MTNSTFGEAEEPKRAPTVRVSRGMASKFVTRSFLTHLLYAILAILAIYLCFAVTIMRFVLTDAGVVLVKNNTYAGERLPANSEAVVQFNTNVDDSLKGRLIEALSKQSPTAEVKVLVGPNGQLRQTSADTVTWYSPDYNPSKPNAKLTQQLKGVTLAKGASPLFLEDEYAGVCLDGACQKGSVVFFFQKNIVGLPVNKSQLGAAPHIVQPAPQAPLTTPAPVHTSTGGK